MPSLFELLLPKDAERQGFRQDVTGLQQFIQNQQQLQQANQQLAFRRQGFPGPVPNFPASKQFPQAQSTAGAGLLGDFLLQQQKLRGQAAIARAKPISPSQQIAQKRLNAINGLQEKDRLGTISNAEKELLSEALLGGGINIDFSKGQLLQTANSLRKEFNTDQRVKDFRILAPKFKNMVSFFERSKTAGQKGPTDIALSKTFQKLTDLMSSVREGEYETTFRGQALLQKLRGGIQKLIVGGEGITPEFRQELVDTARLMFEDGKLFFNQAIEEKGSIADAFNIPRAQILGNIKPLSVTNTNAEFQELFGVQQQPQEQQQGVNSPKTQAEFDAIPSGTIFIDTDGKRKVKQ